MAIDALKLKRRLPPPPTDGNPAVEAAPAVPVAPEPNSVAAKPERPRTATTARKTAGQARAPKTPSRPKAATRTRPAEERLDGRSLRATGRTEQMNFKVRPETKGKLLRLAATRGVLLSALLEEAVELLLGHNDIK